MMETDYSHYAIVHELHQSGQEPSTALQLLSRCRERERAPVAPQRGIWAPVGAGAGLPAAAIGHHVGTQHAGTQAHPGNSFWGE